MRRQTRTLRLGLALMTLIAISHPSYAGEPAPVPLREELKKTK